MTQLSITDINDTQYERLIKKVDTMFEIEILSVAYDNQLYRIIFRGSKHDIAILGAYWINDVK